MVFTKKALKKLSLIHQLSQQYNAAGKLNHRQVLLRLLEEHCQEILSLFQANNPHALVETGDLLVLCLELMIEEGVCPDKLVATCFTRYRRKLSGLLK
ncbi:MAG: hypothetical protein NC911_05595, partial [Candidatus Omnitrophica bacterium]|nr:hypothetical protein [Candidatus Omnitrophota bacterium]